tara:strand:- start:1056 stop:1568 length:513 start_codon:yes stop_codon:yes gene_type:complete
MSNFILNKQNVLTEEECNFFIQKLEENASPLDLRFYTGIYDNFYNYNFLVRKIREVMGEYVELHPFLGKIPFRWNINENINLQKYDPGQSFSAEHCEHGNKEYDSKRVLGWMIYLNTIEEGGETYWPQQDYKAKPMRGSLLIWPSSWTHSHYGIPSQKTKYIITGWGAFN